jgi:hypothetical protein
VIGYYVHHQGSGHLRRMSALTAKMQTPVTVLSSLPPDGSHDWVRLAPDDEGEPVDPDAGGVLHWAPRHDPGMRTRMAQVAEWIRRASPSLVVVDVSVEVALQVRLTGTPVVVVAMPGERFDRAHRLGYDIAEALLAPWPRGANDVRWPPRWRDKTWYVGGISRFDGWPRRDAAPGPRDERGRGVLLWGSGGPAPSPAELDALVATRPGWTWRMLGVHETLSGRALWEALCESDLVVTHAGQNAVADVAAARRPAVLVSQDRPFDEQRATARAVASIRAAAVSHGWPADRRWPALLTEALELGGEAWAAWSSGRGAERSAAAIDALATRFTGMPSPQPLDVRSAS